MPEAPEHYDFIDALRGYAVLGVIVVHAVSIAPIPDGLLHTLLVQGARGVQLFFVASAFTLMLSRDRRGDGVVPFYIRRAFRILPAFWLATLGYLALGAVSPGPWAPTNTGMFDVLSSLFFIPAVYPVALPTVVPGGWTVTCEVAFYLCFPILARTLYTPRLALAAALAGIVAVPYVARVATVVATPIAIGDTAQWLDLFIHFSLANQFPAFLAGIAAYRISLATSIDPRTNKALAVVCLMSLLTIPFVVPQHLLQAAYGAAFGLGLYCLSKGDFRWVTLRSMAALGKISFSAYLIHFSVFNIMVYLKNAGFDPLQLGVVGDPWRLVPLLIVAVAVTSLFASLTYRFVEQPMIGLGRNLLTRLSIDTTATKPA